MSIRGRAVAVALLVVPMLGARGQTAGMDAVRAMYEEVNSDIEYEALLDAKAEVTTIEPAIGHRTSSVGYAYSYESTGETDEAAERTVVRLVWVSYTIAASVAVNIEYLFDPDERCVLWRYRVEGAECGERWYFFRNDSLIAIDEGPTTIECEEDEAATKVPQRLVISDFPTADTDLAKSILERAGRYKRAFESVVRTATIEFTPGP